MHILYLTDNPNLSGTTRIMQSWLLLGRREGFQGLVAVPKRGPLTSWLQDQEIPFEINPMTWPARQWPFPSLWHVWRLGRWARQTQVDVIHCNEHNVYPFGVLLRRLLDLPLVCHVRYAVSRAFSVWAFGGERQPDALLWTSRQQRDDSAASVQGVVPEDRQHIVPLGFDLETFGTLSADRIQTRAAWRIHPEEIVLGTASALRPRKRIEDFIALVEKLAGEDPRVVGLIAGDARPGDEAYRDHIRQQIATTGLGRRLQWVGRLDPVEPFYHACDMFVSTSEYETFGNSVCEAMACQRPVVAYQGGSVHEVVGSAGKIVETGDLNTLTAGVRDLVQRPELREELGRRGRQRVADHFNPSQNFRQLREIYELLVGRKEPQRVRFRRLFGNVTS